MPSTTVKDRQTPISSDQALRVAREDAETVYRDISNYRIVIVLRDDGWHVDYEVQGTGVKGGGPHYVIDQQSGEILSKRYEQ